MGAGSRVQAAGAGIGNVGLNGGKLQLLHKGAGGFAAAGQTKGNDAAAAVRQILLRQCMVRAGLEAAVVDIGHFRVSLKELCDGHAVGAVALHPDVEALKAEVQHIGVHGGLHRAEVAHELCGGLGDESTLFAEALRVGDAMIALIGSTQAGELLGVGHPVKPAAVHDGTAQHRTVAVHVLGGGVGHDIRAPRKGAAVHRRGEGIIHNEGHAVGMGSLGELLNVQHGQGRVCNGLAEDGLGVGAEGGVQLLLGVDPESIMYDNFG